MNRFTVALSAMLMMCVPGTGWCGEQTDGVITGLLPSSAGFSFIASGTRSSPPSCATASGAAATATLRELAGGQGLQCRRTGTSYNRVTAICSNEAGVEINCAMVKSGTAVIWPRYNSQMPICQR